ncbi:MAG: sugar ABC transporter permease [Paracoccaceae bacterium]
MQIAAKANKMTNRTLLLFGLPAYVILLLFFVYPIILTLQLSFTDFRGFGEADWVGLKNYARILSHDRYFQQFLTTIKYAAFAVVFQTLLGLTFASWLHRMPRIRNFCRPALFVPAMLSTVVVAYVWQFIYSPLDGGLNAALESVGLGNFARGWLGSPDTALYAVVAVHVWMYTGYSTAIFLAGYANISEDIDEAGRLDGASSWQRFRHLEIPLLAPSFTIAVVLTTIGTLKSFELPFVMTGGGPDRATELVSIEIIKQLFNSSRFGFASALAILMLVVVVAVAAIQNAILRKNEEI